MSSVALEASPKLARARTWLLGLAAVRIVLGLAAIPLAPFLYREYFVVLVFCSGWMSHAMICDNMRTRARSTGSRGIRR